jgi:adenosylmethionine-8-amino-7-oxononanoate aminotransferase
MTRLLGFRGGYQGGVLTLKPSVLTNEPFAFALPSYHDLGTVETLLREGADQFACAIVEPVMGRASAIPATPEVLRSLRELVAREKRDFSARRAEVRAAEVRLR